MRLCLRNTRKISERQTLEAQNITGSRSEQSLFRDLNFQALPREIIYVRGHNGAGKTTLLRMLCGLVRPDNGTIFWDGVPIADLSLIHI